MGIEQRDSSPSTALDALRERLRWPHLYLLRSFEQRMAEAKSELCAPEGEAGWRPLGSDDASRAQQVYRHKVAAYAHQQAYLTALRHGWDAAGAQAMGLELGRDVEQQAAQRYGG